MTRGRSANAELNLDDVGSGSGLPAVLQGLEPAMLDQLEVAALPSESREIRLRPGIRLGQGRRKLSPTADGCLFYPTDRAPHFVSVACEDPAYPELECFFAEVIQVFTMPHRERSRLEYYDYCYLRYLTEVTSSHADDSEFRTFIYSPNATQRGDDESRRAWYGVEAISQIIQREPLIPLLNISGQQRMHRTAPLPPDLRTTGAGIFVLNTDLDLHVASG
jgi:hypothetical protein